MYNKYIKIFRSFHQITIFHLTNLKKYHHTKIIEDGIKGSSFKKRYS